MKKYFGLIVLLVFELNGSAQSRIVMNNNACLVIDNSAYLVIDNSNANAITTAGIGGNIISENELDVVQWNISTATGTYTVPLSSATLVKIPLSVAITTAGVGAGNIIFSTYTGGSWDNSVYPPSDVTHMTDITGTLNNSAFVIDRFWRIDALLYTTKPAVTLSIGYNPAEYLAAGNTILEANLQAQRFNNTTDQWYDWVPHGTDVAASDLVNGILVLPADFYKSWTLVDKSSPLPIELLSFDYDCDNDYTDLKWITASETNNDYFTLEKSHNGSLYEPVTIVPGNNGNSVQYYSYADINDGLAYYRLKQTDFDGQTTYSDIIAADCGGINNSDVNAYFDSYNLHISINSGFDDLIQIRVLDFAGRLVKQEEQEVSTGFSHFIIEDDFVTGPYIISISSNHLNKIVRLYKN